nr:purine/pyrimidine permease [Anaerovorax odorimutans]
MWIYSIQHLIYFAAGTVVLPIAVGIYLELSQQEIAEMLQRTFFLCGITSYLQVKLGHTYPIIDGPAGLWASMFIVMAVSASGTQSGLAGLRISLQTGIVIAGAIVMILAVTGLVTIIAKLFTPIVNGVIITLMVLQMSATFVKGILGVTDENAGADLKSIGIFLITVATILFVAVYLGGFVQSIATLIGVIVGWVLAVLVGLSVQRPTLDNLVSLPRLWAWGTPAFDLGITIACVLSALVLLSMSFASISSMAEAVGEEVSNKTLSRSVFFHGLSTLLAGLFSVIPFMPFVSSTGVVLMTRVAARRPFNIACLLMVVFGIFSPIAAFFASMPSTVAYATSMVIFALILGQGLKEFKKVELGNRECYIIGLSMICGMGVMFLPQDVFATFPQTLHFILSNGLVVGTVMSMALEQIFRKKKIKDK